MMNFLAEPITKNPWAALSIGLLSSIVSIAPTALSLQAKRPASLKFYQRADLEGKVLYLPWIEAAINVGVFYVVNTFFPEELRRYWVVGIIMGVIYPTMGWLSRLPQDVYGVTSPVRLFLTAQILYGLLYGVGFALLMSKITTK